MSTILLAEDDSAIIEIVTYILKGSGFSVVSVTTSDEVLAYLKKHKPSLILLDISLEGEKIARKIKRDPSTAKIPLLILSANPETETIAKATGADGFLQKPFDMEELIATVSRYVVS